MLDDAGYVADDGMLVALPSGGYSLTTTSGGAGRAAGWLELVADRRGADVHVVDLTEVNGAILVAGPRSRALLQEITDDDVSSEAFPYMAQRDLVVGGIECSAMRVGFVGELSFELHHRRDRSVPLWAALSAAGSAFDLVPHGLDALDVLRLEKGHLYIGQDTLPDDTPRKLGLERMVDMGKGDFVGRAGLVRLDGLPQEQSLAGLSFGDGARPDDLAGQPIWLGGDIVGRVTSCEFSPTLGGTIGLGWLHVSVAGRSDALRAADVSVRRVPTPFIDPEGSRVRG
jgi:sarcosine oxidase subunit alpha